MKYLLALIAAVAFTAPVFAQEAEKREVRTVKVRAEGGVTIIEDGEEVETVDEADIKKRIEDALRRAGEEVEEIDEAELPEEVRDVLKRFREQMEELRKEFEERMKEIQEDLENGTEDLENDPDAEVEEYEHTSPDGSSTVKVKIVRIRKIVKEGDAPEAPEAPKTNERKQ